MWPLLPVPVRSPMFCPGIVLRLHAVIVIHIQPFALRDAWPSITTLLHSTYLIIITTERIPEHLPAGRRFFP